MFDKYSLCMLLETKCYLEAMHSLEEVLNVFFFNSLKYIYSFNP